MGPRSLAHRRQTESQNEHVYRPGVIGRRTGATLADDGRRDEFGFQPMNDLFSSPDKDLEREAQARRNAEPDDEQDEQDMEIDDGSEFGPATARKLQQGRPSLPRSRSPIKTNLNSPARQNPHILPTSSPVRGSIVTARNRSPALEVARKLNFSKEIGEKKKMVNGHAKENSASSRKLTNGHSQTARRGKEPVLHYESDEREPEDEPEEDEPLALIDAGDDGDGDFIEDQAAEETDEDPEDVIPVRSFKETNKASSKPTSKSKPPARGARQPRAAVNSDPPDAPMDENEEDEEPVKKKGPRSKAAARPQKSPSPVADPAPAPKKRGRLQKKKPEDEAGESAAEPRETKRQKTSARADAAEQSTSSKPAAPKQKPRAERKRKSSGVGVASPVIQRGPPLPKSRGLVTVRREETSNMTTTRSGRASFKPLEWWKGERVEYDEEQEDIFEDAGNRHFKMPTVKGVIRTESPEPEAAPKRRNRPAGRKAGKQLVKVEEDEEEREDWEFDGGRMVGEVVAWDPKHEFEPPGDDDEVDVVDEELAIAESAIHLRDIKDATFKFAKTLTLPFFGTGVVDLPPGAEKRPKNSRKMHLVFFVHAGNVQASVAQNEFGIAKGGMFFVPRGNSYCIRNETDKPARLFFAQGCEVLVQPNVENEEA